MTKRQTAFRLDEQVLKDLKQVAKKFDRSRNWVVNHALKLFAKQELEKTSSNGK